MQINKVSSRLLIVSDKITHQDIEQVIIDWDGFAKARHGKVTSDERGISSYTDKRTALSLVASASCLDANGADELLSAIMIKQIKFISVPVADQKRALDFYTDKLGFTIITDQPFDEKQRWIELRIPKAETRVVLFTPEGEEKRIGTMMNMSYECDDIDKTYAEMKKRGVEFEGPPQKQPWGTYAMFKDSEGNRFVVSS
jgi:predicted enzyme related to lactoylglutathione lyase